MPAVAKVRLFSNVDTDSDEGAAEGARPPSHQSLPALSFRTEPSKSKDAGIGSGRSSSISSSIDFRTETVHDRPTESDPRPASHASAPQPRRQHEKPAPSEEVRDGLQDATADNPAASLSRPPAAQTRNGRAAAAAQIVSALENSASSSKQTTAMALPTTALSSGASVTHPGAVVSSDDADKSRQTTQTPAPTASPTAAAQSTVHVNGTTALAGRLAPGEQLDSVSDGSEERSDDFAEDILPRHRGKHTTLDRPRTSQLLHRGLSDTPDLPVEQQDGALNEVLVRAQLRLQEKRLMANVSGPPPALVTTPRQCSTRVLTYNNNSSLTRNTDKTAGSAATPPESAGGTTPARVVEDASQGLTRRLSRENNHLRQEVALLTRDNLRLRGLTHSADTAEVTRLQLTVDLLKTELQQSELAHQRVLAGFATEKGELERQLGEVVEQVEGYAGAATQYKALYEDKLRELEAIKRQVQGLMQDVVTMERRQRSAEADFHERLLAEQGKSEKMMHLLDDVKAQREHVRVLNEQLQREARRAAEERASAQSAVKALEAQLQQTQMTHEQACNALQAELASCRTTLTEKERSHAAYVRETERVQEALQQRLHDAMQDSSGEVARLRQLIERVRIEGKAAVEEQTKQCATLKAQLISAEEAKQTAVAHAQDRRHAQDVQRMEEYRQQLAQVRATCEAAEQEQARLSQTNAQLQGAVEHYKRECSNLLADMARSEQLREEATQEQLRLSTTLEQLTAHDEAQARRVAQLERLLAEAQEEVGRYRALVGPSTEEAASDMKQLADENERLSDECARLTTERNALVEENGKIAQELLKWRQEMNRLISARSATLSTATALSRPSSTPAPAVPRGTR